MHALDNIENLVRLDKTGMLQVISKLPDNALKSLQDAEKLDLKDLTEKKYRSLIVLGMGGSAIGGLLIRDWLYELSMTPIFVSSSYNLPRWVNKDDLIFAVSYSGNTEETLNQLKEAQKKGCSIVSFTSGGQLSKICVKSQIPCYKFPKGYQPRAAIGFQFFGLAKITERFGLIEKRMVEIKEAINIISDLRDRMHVNVKNDENLGKDLAKKLYGYIPIVYGNRLLKSVAYRYSTQFNENSKIPAGYGFFPEAFHNHIMAREAQNEILEKTCVLIIRDPKETEKMKEKINKFSALMAEKIKKVIEVKAIGEARLSRIMSALYIGDYTSTYLGLLYDQDPGSIDSINILKS
jgi:glucose/mannose-6-phosphate isomerase